MRALLLFAALTLAAPDRPDPDRGKYSTDNRSFSDRIQGEWQVVTSLTAGRPHTGVKPGEAVFIFKGDKLTITRPNLTNIYDFTVDPSKTPMAFTMRSSNIKGKDVKGAVSPGIISLEGDTLSICLRPVNNEFASNVGTTTILWQVKRK